MLDNGLCFNLCKRGIMRAKIKYWLIDEYIEKHNLTKTKFCRMAGISNKTLGKIYSLEGSHGCKTLIRLSKILNVRLCRLFIYDPVVDNENEKNIVKIKKIPNF